MKQEQQAFDKLKMTVIKIAVALVALLVLGFVLFFVTPLKNILSYLIGNPTIIALVIAGIVLVVAILVWLGSRQSQQARVPFWECLRQAYENPESGGLYNAPVGYEDLDKRFILKTWLLPHSAWLARGELREAGCHHTAIIFGLNKDGEVLDEYDFELSKKDIAVLQKKDVSLEDAKQKILETHAALESVKEGGLI